MSITEERSDKGAKNRCPTNQQGTAMPTRSAARRPDRRRRAAVAFLSNISLDGRPLAGLPCSSPFPTPIADDRSPQEFGVSDGCSLLAASSLQAPVQHSLTPMAQFGPAMEGATPIGFPEGPGSSQGGTFCRRLLSQQSSAETSEEPEDTPFPLRRSLQTTRSSAQQNLRRVHLIRTLRQHDTGNARIVLISAKRSFCTVFSVLPYRDPPTYGEIKGEGGRQRHPSSCTPSARDIVAGLEGVDVGADGKTVSYAQLLSPAYLPPCSMQTGPRTLQRLATLDMGTRVNPPLTETGAGLLEGLEPGEYDPTLLDNPQWLSGRHKRVLLFPSYMTTVVEYVRPADLKKGMNETFREKFPHIHLTLSKIRSLKRDMRRVALDDCGLEEAALAASYVHFEKLVLQARLEKSNRKLVAGVCLLLAAKTTCDLRRTEVKNLIDKLEERFRVNRRELIAFEFPVLVALQFGLHLPDNQVLPHYHRLTC